MDARRENPMAIRSRTALIIAATELLDGRAASDVSIKDVVDASGLSRPTFYQHFSDLGMLFAAAGLARLEETFADIDAPHEAPVGLEGAFAPVFTVIVNRMGEHAKFYARVLESAGGTAFHQAVVTFTSQRLRREPLLQNLTDAGDAFWDFLAAGTVGLLTAYLAGICQHPDVAPVHPSEDLAHIFGLIFTRQSV